MDYLPLVRPAWVHLPDESDPRALTGPVVRSGTLGAMIRWMHEQDEQQRARFVVGVQNSREALTYQDIELIAARQGTLGNELHRPR